MNFKKFSMIAFALVATSIATSAAFAQAGGTPVTPVPVPRLAPPDISVKIEMFEDAAGQKPIPNGANLSYTGGAPAAFVRFTLSNSNSQNTGNFTYKRVIYRNGVKVIDPPAATISLAKGEVKVFPMEQVYFSGTSNTVEAKILADIGNLVKETIETNNSATYTVKASVVH